MNFKMGRVSMIVLDKDFKITKLTVESPTDPAVNATLSDYSKMAEGEKVMLRDGTGADAGEVMIPDYEDALRKAIKENVAEQFTEFKIEEKTLDDLQKFVDKMDDSIEALFGKFGEL